ncbi:MAG: glycosyltransferase family 2 protein, partial [bacterium]|nr:glycosyltransferase family 2 protein [bacterium]
MVGSKPLVSIIVLTYNSQRHIRPCLTALFKTKYEDFEVIVVDNASADETIEIVKKEFPKTRLFLNKTNLGYAAGNNLAVEKTRGSLVAFINPDTTVSPGWLEPLVSAIEPAKIAACQPKILLSKEKHLLNGTGKTTNFLGFDWLTDYQKKDKQMKVREITSFSGSAVLTKKEIFLSLSGFDEDFFMYGEDSDLSWRMRLSGFKILFTPESVVYHEYKYKPEEHIQKASKKFYLLERNRIVTLLKNYSLKTLILLLPVFLFMEVGMNIY